MNTLGGVEDSNSMCSRHLQHWQKYKAATCCRQVYGSRSLSLPLGNLCLYAHAFVSMLALFRRRLNMGDEAHHRTSSPPQHNSSALDEHLQETSVRSFSLFSLGSISGVVKFENFPLKRSQIFSPVPSFFSASATSPPPPNSVLLFHRWKPLSMIKRPTCCSVDGAPHSLAPRVEGLSCPHTLQHHPYEDVGRRVSLGQAMYDRQLHPFSSWV